MYFQLNRYFNGSLYIREREEHFQLKANIGTRTNGYKQPMNKFSLEIRRFFTIRVEFCNSFSIGVVRSNNITSLKIELDKFINEIKFHGCLQEKVA